MIPSSAMVTIGEDARAIARMDTGEIPRGELRLLRSHFGDVVAMTDRGLDPRSFGAFSRFALSAYLETWDRRRIYLSEELPGIQFLAAHAAALAPKKRIVLLIHNSTSRLRWVPLRLLGLARLVDRFLCISQRTKLDLIDRYGVSPASIDVIGSRVDTTFFKPDPAARTLAQVCSAGAVNRDYATLIEAVRPLGVPTKIAADTAWRYSASEIDSKPPPAFVEMRSWGTYEKLRRLYAESALVAIPLLRDALSGVTVALEAMAMGKPVIITRSDHTSDFVRDGETGLLVTRGDAEAMRRAIRRLLDHPADAEAMGARAREWVVERFTVEGYADAILRSMSA